MERRRLFFILRIVNFSHAPVLKSNEPALFILVTFMVVHFSWYWLKRSGPGEMDFF